MWTLKQIITFIRFAFPPVLRLIWDCFWQAVGMVVLSIIALFQGLGVTANNIAEKWVEEALANGFPTLWERQLRLTCRVLARVTIVGGWFFLLFTEWHVVNYTLKWIFA